MAFDFNNFANSVTKSVTKLGQEASSVTKNVTGTVKYNGIISDQKKIIEATYVELGKKYFNKFANSEDCEFKEEIDRINAAFKQIEFCEQQQKEMVINNAAAGSVCTKCGAKLNPNASFCTKCGNKIEKNDAQPENSTAPVEAAYESAVTTEETKTVQSEVQPEVQPAVQPEPVKVTFCPDCGNQVGADMIFCTQCGKKLN